MSEFEPIENYGIIGDLSTCALVSKNGSIDWCCMPHMELSSVFGKILDLEKGGCFSISPDEDFKSKSSYIENTNVLQTHFESEEGKLILTDFMPVQQGEANTTPIIFRKLECVEGSLQYKIHFEPRFDYGRVSPKMKKKAKGIAASIKKQRLFLRTQIPFDIDMGIALANAHITEGECVWLVLQYDRVSEYTSEQCEQILEDTIRFWQDWAHTCEINDQCIFHGSWHDAVVRSGLVLKLLTHRQTGAICAAPTTSLPETIGGVRNWDYRVNWMRDASFTVQALYNMGHKSEALQFLQWFSEICQQSGHPSQLQAIYGLQGDTELTELELDQLSGYKNSKPVRVGNASARLKQWNIFGEVINAVWEISRYGEEITEVVWGFVAQLIDFVCATWNTPDYGIWNVDGEEKHFVYSKIMCWVAMDRGVRIARQRKYYHKLGMWQSVRETIRMSILQNGFDEELGSFVQSYGSKSLDATGLLIPLMGFLPVDEPKVVGTIEAIQNHLSNEEGFIYRYQTDNGLPGQDGIFIPCTFWMVDVLAMSGKRNEAESLFQRIVDHASPLGLLSGDLDSKSGMLLGNYPQAFSHIGLINSALFLGKAAGKKQAGPEPFMETANVQ